MYALQDDVVAQFVVDTHSLNVCFRFLEYVVEGEGAAYIRSLHIINILMFGQLSMRHTFNAAIYGGSLLPRRHRGLDNDVRIGPTQRRPWPKVLYSISYAPNVRFTRI